MNRLAITFLSLAVSTVAFAPVAKAQQPRPYDMQQSQGEYILNRPFMESEVSPFNLTTMAYRGYLSQQGIPAYGNLLVALQTGSVTADDIIEAAINEGLIPYNVQDDASYENALEQQLDVLVPSGS